MRRITIVTVLLVTLISSNASSSGTTGRCPWVDRAWPGALTDGTVADVSSAPGSDWLVAGGFAWRRVGTTWSSFPMPVAPPDIPGTTYSQIWSDIWANDSRVIATGMLIASSPPDLVNTPTAARFDGGFFVQVPIDADAQVSSIRDLDGKGGQILAVGADSGVLVDRWDGTTFTSEDVPAASGSLDGVDVFSPTLAWAVGSSPGGPLILVWDGRDWRRGAVSSLPDDVELIDVSIRAHNDVWVLGRRPNDPAIPYPRPYVARWDGRRWHRLKVPWPGEAQIVNALEFEHGTTWVVGARIALDHPIRQRMMILRMEGSAWDLERTPSRHPTELRHIELMSSGTMWAAGFTRSVSGVGPGTGIVARRCGAA